MNGKNESNSELVFSTDGISKKSAQSKPKQTSSPIPSGGPVRTRREKKGRAGKTAILIFELPWSKMEAKQHMRALQSKLACGASYKEGKIIIQGDLLEEIHAYFKEHQIAFIHSGG